MFLRSFTRTTVFGIANLHCYNSSRIIATKKYIYHMQLAFASTASQYSSSASTSKSSTSSDSIATKFNNNSGIKIPSIKLEKKISIKEFKPLLQSLKIDENANSNNKDIKNAATTIQIKKRQQRKKRNIMELEDYEEIDDSLKSKGFYSVTALATAEEYDLEKLLEGLEEQDLYSPQKFFSTDNLGAEQDVLYVTAKYQIENESRDIFFFREGSVVLWNCNEVEINNVLQLLRNYERDSYRQSLVKGESEIMPYTYLIDPEADEDTATSHHNTHSQNKRAQFKNNIFYLTRKDNNFFEKYTFSNALTTSVKLGIWEATLDLYIDSMEFIIEDLKRGTKIRINRHDLLRKTGELFALRHLINLSSDLLDTPDFYWDREELESLYLQLCNYFSITRRTKVMNEKLNHCVELAELVSSHLNDAHHVRLEWMIIILIMVEVAFETIHYIERYYSNHINNDEQQQQQRQVFIQQ